MREAFQVAPQGLAAAGPRLRQEIDVIGRARADLARLLVDVAEQLPGMRSADAAIDVAAAAASASTALTAAVGRLAASMDEAARTYDAVDSLVCVLAGGSA